MKVAICDLCRSDNKVSYAPYVLRLKGEIGRLTVDLCEKHKDTFKGKTHKEAVRKFLKVIDKPQKRIDLLFK